MTTITSAALEARDRVQADLDAATVAEAAQGLGAITTALENDSAPALPALDYMRGYLARVGPIPGASDVRTMRGWLEALIGEVDQLRGELLDLAVLPETGRKVELTEVEVAIFRYLRNTRMTVPEIAGARFVSVNTIKTHAKNIYRKCDVGSRAELRGLPSM